MRSTLQLLLVAPLLSLVASSIAPLSPPPKLARTFGSNTTISNNTATPFTAAPGFVPFPNFVGSNGFGTNSTISTTCAAALNHTINCDPGLQTLALSNALVSPNTTSIAGALCASSCNSSLTSYHSNVIAQCGSSPVINSQLLNTWMGDFLQDYYNLICTQDPGTGQYCVDYLNSAWAGISAVSSFSQVPQELLCSPCLVSYFATIQSSPFFGYNLDLEAAWLATQQTCGLNLPLDVNPASNLSTAAGTVPPVSAGNLTCISGNKIIVQTGDTCESIALANSVSQGTLWAINNLTPDCSLLKVGQTLCLPQTCTTYTLQPDDSCWSIATANGLSFASIISYNPTINPSCSNLNITGSVICISNPHGDYVPPPVGTTAVGADQTEYANSSTLSPGDTPFGTTTNCGTWYQVQVADFCQRISLSAAISVDLFKLINPSINADCTNLVPGLWYCVQPVFGWNTTSSGNTSTILTTQAPPAPTPPGTTGSCYEWYVVESGDNCALLQNVYGVTMDELMLWNPNLNADCSNLLLGEAYCLSGPFLTSSGTVSLPTSTSSHTSTSSYSTSITRATLAPPAPTPPGTTNSCFAWHIVVSGDSCFALEQSGSITMAQLVQWNPNLLADCSNLLLGEAYCIAGPTSPPTSTISSTAMATQAPPAPTPPGTTSSCFEWHIVVSGDYCFAIEQTYGITMAQLILWNPNLDSACDNLLLGEAYCVSG